MTRVKLKKKLYVLNVSGLLMMGVVVLLSSLIYIQFHYSIKTWKTYLGEEIAINNALAEINENIGYGGFIHNFKNLVLRRDIKRYQSEIEQNLANLDLNFKKIKALVTSEKELLLVGEIEKTVIEYQKKYEVAKKMILAKKSSEEIDLVVTVDDTSAFAAIRKFSLTHKKRADELEGKVRMSHMQSITVLQVSTILVCIFIVFVTWLLSKYLKKEFSNKLDLLEKIEQAEKANAAKSQFLANMSHEFRTPLTAVKGTLSLFEADALPNDPEMVKKLMQAAISNCNHLNTLIDEVLDVDKLKNKDVNLNKEVYEVGSIINNAINDNKKNAAKCGVHFIAEESDCYSSKVYVDEESIVRVLSVLLLNAIRHSSNANSDNVIINVECDDSFVRVLITDHGEGISQEHQSHIFESFYQADSSDTRKIGGLGLGLTIAKEIIVLHGGRIGCNSTQGEGATFYIELQIV